MNIDVEQQNGICVLRCKGRFIAGPDLEYMHSKMDEIKRLRCTRVLVDFHEVPSIGSMGVTFLVGLYTSVVKESGGRFVLVGAVPIVRQVLELTRLDTVIPLAPDFASGLARLCDQRSNPARARLSAG